MQDSDHRHFPTFPNEAEQLMQDAAAAVQKQDRSQLAPAEAKVRRALELASAGSASVLERAEAWLSLGHIQELQNSPEKIADAALSYENATELLRPTATGGVQQRVRTIVGLMNHGNALQKLGTEEQTRLALRSYDEAVALVQGVPEGTEDRLIGALWINRGGALQRYQGDEALRGALASFRSAILALDRAATSDGHAGMLGLAARINLADTMVRTGSKSDLLEAHRLATAVLGAIEDGEEKRTDIADLGLRARRVTCQTAGALLQNPETTTEEKRDQLATATDRAEESLNLAQFWEARDFPAFRPWVRWFFEFGSAVYAHHQPHFLAEFLTETLFGEKTPRAWTDSQELRRIALAATARVRTAFREKLFGDVNGPDSEVLTARLAELQDLEKQLNTAPSAQV